MRLRHLVRIGRWYFNPRYLIKVEDRAQPATDPTTAEMAVTCYPGDTVVLSADESAELRRLLEEETASSPPPPPHEPPPPLVLSGTGPGPLVRDAPPGGVPE